MGDLSGRGLTHRLHFLFEELIICLVHGREVFHGREENINLQYVVEAAARSLQHGREVLKRSSLHTSTTLKMVRPIDLYFSDAGLSWFFSYSLVLHATLDQRRRSRVEANAAGAVDHAIVLDGLRELGQRLRRLVRGNLFGERRHRFHVWEKIKVEMITRSWK